jgi:uncharacterized membrane protein YtjA (UPF0391 family)
LRIRRKSGDESCEIRRQIRLRGGLKMLRWALGFFIIALVAALLGFGGIAVAAAGIARILFFIFLILFLVALLGGIVRRA